MSHDVIYFPSEKYFSDRIYVCPMDPSEPSESRFVHRSQIASIGHICKMLDCLKENVLCNYDWLITKLRATSFRDLINDFHAASETFPDDGEIGLILETLQLSTTALIQDPAQLASQLVGRLLDKIKRPENEGIFVIFVGLPAQIF